MNLTNVELGVLGSAFAWVYGLGALFAGSIVDRIRRKTAILGGLHAWSVICMATALSKTFPHLVFFRAAEGLGETFYFPASMSLISDYHGKSTRSRAMGSHQTSVYVGTIGGGFFAGLIGQYYGWRWSFVVFGAMGILLGILLHYFLVEPERGAADRAEGNVPPPQKPMSIPAFLKLATSTPTILVLLAAFICSNFVATVVLSWMPKFVYDRFQMDLAKSGLTATLYIQVASMLACPIGGWLADILRKRTPGGRMMVQAAGVLCGAPFVVICGGAESLSVLIPALIGWGLCKGLYDANIFASVYDVVPAEARGATAGLMNTVGWLAGGGTAPIVVGWIADNGGLGYAISLTAAVYVVAGLLLLAGILFFVGKDSERAQLPDFRQHS